MFKFVNVFTKSFSFLCLSLLFLLVSNNGIFAQEEASITATVSISICGNSEIEGGNLPLNVNQNAVELNLQNKGLTSLPSEIGKLTNLTTFDVSHNNLTGALPAEIGKFTKLETLDASDNNLTGIPAEIGKLTKLQTVDFSNNGITDYPMEIYNLTQLKTLDLRNNPFSQEKINILKEKLPNTTILF